MAASSGRKHPALGWIVFALCLVALAAGVAVFSQNSKKKKYEIPVPAVQVQRPARGTVVESVTISGYIEARAMIPVVPFVSGTITEYAARAGDYVKKDTVLAKIDDAPFRQQMLQAQAAYWGYQSTFERVESLYKTGATTQQNYDSVKAQRDAAKAQFDLAKLQLDYTQVKAPVSGTILAADLAVGSIGTQTQPVAVIADLSNLVVRLKVPEKYFDLFQLQKDQIKVSVVRPAEKGMYGDAVSPATIETVAPYVSAESKNFQVLCRLTEPGERFRPGMYVKVTAAYRSHSDVPVIPLTALKLDGSYYTYDPQTETVHYHAADSAVSDSSSFVVPAELADSWFVVDGQNSVFDGQKVKRIDGAAK